ncbi:MAG: MBL fold metallo-hydrolase [Ignavibacteriales bacterium]|nr:MBL fold metallo-hydrolase [Ignavibacteriales bacterium]
MKIGKYELVVLETGTFALDGGAMFGIIPKLLWQNSNPPDEMNRVTLGARCLMLVSDSKKILIDTSLGSGWDEKFMRIYNVNQNGKLLTDTLNGHGYKREEITDVILTHLHFDHTGGSTTLADGKWVPAFPNAKYHVQKKHFEWALNPTERDRGSFIANRFMPLHEEGLLNLIDYKKEFDDEIEFIVINGHTFSQQMVKISDGNQTVLYCGDLLPFASHIPIPYVMGYDLQPLETVREKKELYPKAIEENWILFFEHDPKIAAATIIKTEKGFSVKETFTEL